jgi:hypothetical protein
MPEEFYCLKVISTIPRNHIFDEAMFYYTDIELSSESILW